MRIWTAAAIVLPALLGLAAATPARAADVADLAWIAGCWAADDREPGSGEYWVFTERKELLGIGRTVADGRTVSYEFMRIRREDEGIAFTAQPSCRDETQFLLVRHDGDEAVFENPGHDFPQRITYRRLSQDRLVARIEGAHAGELRAVSFPMTRERCELLARRPSAPPP